MHDRKLLGDVGETLVAKYLEKRGFSIIAKNFSCKFGEIDLIAQNGEILSFVEVKTRKTVYFPISTVVTRGKQRKLTKAAKYYIMQRDIIDKVCRFDVATVFHDVGESKIDYIENAFYGI